MCFALNWLKYYSQKLHFQSCSCPLCQVKEFLLLNSIIRSYNLEKGLIELYNFLLSLFLFCHCHLFAFYALLSFSFCALLPTPQSYGWGDRHLASIPLSHHHTSDGGQGFNVRLRSCSSIQVWIHKLAVVLTPSPAIPNAIEGVWRVIETDY